MLRSPFVIWIQVGKVTDVWQTKLSGWVRHQIWPPGSKSLHCHTLQFCSCHTACTWLHILYHIVYMFAPLPLLFPELHFFLFVCSFAKSAILKQFPCISLTWGVFDLISRSSETKWKIWLANWDKSSTPRFPCPPKTWSNISVVYFLPCSNFSLPALFECVCVW